MKKWLAMALLLLAPALRAGDVALYYLNNAALDWEGSGYRDNSTGGWEIKDKPQGPAFALRWKQSLTRDLDAQIFYVRNKPYYSFENGADGLAALNEQQTGETRIAMNEINIDVRRPLEDSKFGVLAGGQGISEIFNRKDISYWGTPDTSTAREALCALGGYLGVYTAGLPAKNRGFYWDMDFSIGHYFWTHNAIKDYGGSMHSNGFFYAARLEAGWQIGRMRLGAGWIRQEMEIIVPAGKELPISKATASLPDNKTDFSSPFISLTYVY